MLSRKQFLDRGILTTLCLSALGALIPQLHADDLSDFDQKQSERLSEIQKSLKDEQSSKDIAQAKLKEVSAELKKYKQFGPNRIRVATQLATEKVKKDVLSALGVAAHSDEQGAFSYVANKNLEEYGISLVFDNVKKTWKAELAGNSSAEKQGNLKRFTETIKKNVSPPELWEEMDSKARELFAPNALSSLSLEIQGIVSDDEKVRPEIQEKIEKKIKSLSAKDSGEIQKLEKELIGADTKDGSEKRLLLAEQKTYESLGKGEAGKSIDDVCRDFAQNVSNELDLNRRLSSFVGKDDPCSPAFKEVASKSPSSNSRGLAAGATGSELGVDKIGAFPGGGTSSPSTSHGHKGNDEEPNDPENSVGGDKIKKQKSYLSKAEQKKLKETHPEIAEKIKDLESKYNQAMGVIDAQSKQAIINSCNQAAANLKKSIGLGSDNEKNEKIVSGITDKLEKTLAKGYQGLVCDKSGANDGLATNASMEEASKDVLKGLGIPATGPLTQSKQNTLESLSKGAMEVAANFANQRRNRMKLDFQMLEAASKKALSRIATENPNLMDANTLSYLRTLSYNELIGVIPNALPPEALQTYQNYFDIAVMDIKQKNGMGEEFDKQAECALAFAQTATQRWAEEEDRKGLLSLRVRGSSSGLPVSNPTTVRNEESTRKVERNR